MKTAWFCPSCQKHHAPHVETCPGTAPVWVDVLPPQTPFHPKPSWPLTPGWKPSHLRDEPDPCAGCTGACGNAACPKRPFITSVATGTARDAKLARVQ